ncbi:methyltransferase domain-containing protein [Acinetobacter pittii]|uniref:class I SAM-dependent methyltransferase n=1 Tax=Acinetobacter pittii TaxID=48296 RepID=UPI0021D0F29A|nr:methyltransferase domain-containing protein [Acinetobacter pittii]MCU4526605.1 methyltransferase domain-containing protein [Acinetobacter pittii]
MSELTEIFDRIAEHYDVQIPYFTSFAQDLVEWRPPKLGTRVLDVATGNGACLISIGQLEVESLVGIDISPKMLLSAKNKCLAAKIPVTLEVADAHNLPFDTASFDVIYCASSWPFFKNPDLVARELYRIAADGAHLTISLMTSSQHTWPFLKEMISSYSFSPSNENDSKLIDLDSIILCLQKSGWHIDDIKEYHRDFEFHSAEQWLAWHWSHYGRRHFERIPPSDLQNFLNQVLVEANSVQRHVGLRITQRVAFIGAINRF